ncbi:hypothetical protein AWB81_04250 [Caballeronia arationis]|uniref:hypothetical protein n=1 Tax=Caballeronia arationis TaxID=1777142 RepID=UPI00074B41A4|nr:hypothetical protein [Caballeronia arationis]SAK83904.1 hypothetical protein AWB81_04250 [Caballeronia arationis]
MKARFILLCVAAAMIVAVVGCGGDQSIAASVPPATTKLITTISSSDADYVPGSILPLQPDGTVPFLIAGDSSGNPYLLSLGSANGVLDRTSTVVAMVRIALDLAAIPAGLTADQITKAIQSSSQFQALSESAQRDLEAGISPLSDNKTVNAAWAVALDASAAIASSSTAKTSAVGKTLDTTTLVTTPLPFYLLNGTEPFSKIWLTDAGQNNVTVNNDTFITWVVYTDGPEPTKIPPLQSTVGQLFAYYGGSASTTLVKGQSPNFKLNLVQNPVTRRINGVAAFVKYMLFLYSSTAKLYPKPELTNCVISVAERVFNDQFPSFVVQPSGTTAGAYFASVLPISSTGSAPYKQFSSCGLLPSFSTLFASFASKVWPTLNVGGFVVKAWTALTVAQGLVSTVGAAAQMFAYWDEADSFVVCTGNGSVVNCAAASVTSTSCTKIADNVDVTSGFGAGKWGPTYSIKVEGRGTGQATGDQLIPYLGKFPGCVGCAGPGDAMSCSAGWQATPVGVGSPSCTLTGGASSLTYTFSETFSNVVGDEVPPQSFRACITHNNDYYSWNGGNAVGILDSCTTVSLDCH